jgi:hypothetical protein
VKEDHDTAAGGKALTFRAIAMGLIGVVALCFITPYNNLVVANTDLIGNHFPAGVLLLILIVVLLINAPLSRFFPALAFRRGEMIVMLSMWLIGSAFPYVGLGRYFPGQTVAYWYHASASPEYATLMSRLDLPDWLFPTMDATTPEDRGNNEQVIRGYFDHFPADRSTFAGRVRAVPWSRWVTPALTWGLFFGALLGAGMLIPMLLYRQWSEVERLSFPLAGVYLSLIDTPPPGRWLSGDLRSRLLWISAGTVFALHSFNSFAIYTQESLKLPQLSISFSIGSIFADTPIRFGHWTLSTQYVYFTIVGLMFFVRSNVAFSLWFFYLLGNVVRIIAGTQAVEVSEVMTIDQIMGAVTVMAIWTLWLCRSFLWSTLASFYRGVSSIDEWYERICFGLLLTCVAIIIGWLTAAGASLIGAVVLTALLLAMFLVTARVLAETGLLYALLPIEPQRAWLYMLGSGGEGAIRTTLPSFFFSSALGNMLCHDSRQSIPGFASTVSRISADAVGRSDRRQRIGFLGLMFTTVVVGFVASGASTLFVRYNYKVTTDKRAAVVDTGSNWGSFAMPRDRTMAWTSQYTPPKDGPIETHNRVGHFATGAVITSILGFLRVRFVGWPLDPIGYLLCWTWGISIIWFSIFLGWLAKLVALYMGGGRAVVTMRPVFIGLVVGETLAVVFWLGFSFCRALLGMDYTAIQILPS